MSQKKHQLTPLVHIKDNIILENFSKPVTLCSLYPPLSNFDPQNEAPENFQIPHFLSLSCSFKSNSQNQHLLFNPLSLSLSLSHPSSLPPINVASISSLPHCSPPPLVQTTVNHRPHYQFWPPLGILSLWVIFSYCFPNEWMAFITNSHFYPIYIFECLDS